MEVKGYTFRKQGKYPLGNSGVQWVKSKAICMRMAKMASADTLVSISIDNKIINEINLNVEGE